MRNPLDVLEFDELIDSFEKNLAVNLRGFSLKESFLDGWVPEADNNGSIVGLVEAAQLNGKQRLTLKISPKTRPTIDISYLEEQIKPFGGCQINEKEGWLELGFDINAEVDEKLVPQDTEDPGFRSPYRLKLGSLVDVWNFRFDKEIKGANVYTGSTGETTFFLKVDPKKDRVVAVSYQNASCPEEKVLLEMLCGAVEGLPPQEAADHGVLKVEYRLRDEDCPVNGIVIPEFVDRIFERPQILIRECVDSFKRDQGIAGHQNDYDLQVDPVWAALDPAQQSDKITDVMLEFLRTQGLKTEISLVSIVEGFRLTLSFSDATPMTKVPRLLRQLEKEFHHKIDPRIEVFLDEKKDQSLARRL